MRKQIEVGKADEEKSRYDALMWRHKALLVEREVKVLVEELEYYHTRLPAWARKWNAFFRKIDTRRKARKVARIEKAVK